MMDFLKSEIAIDVKKLNKATDKGLQPKNWPKDNIIQPFMIEASGLHGRYIRLGSQLDAILKRHKVPKVALTLLGEFLSLSVGLAAALKYEGAFTLQTKSDGPVSLIVTDVTHECAMRGYVQTSESFSKSEHQNIGKTPIPQFLGNGYLAFTVDFSTSSERHQGIVSLQGDTLSEVIDHYFKQSAQFTASAHMMCDQDDNNQWRGGCLFLHHIPPEGGTGGQALAEDDWNRAVTLMKSATKSEMLDQNLDPATLLYRLFNEDGVRLFEPRRVYDQCRCSESRMRHALTGLPKDELHRLFSEGPAELVCEFCNTKRVFTETDILS